MKYFSFFLAVISTSLMLGQQMKLTKGMVIDSVAVNDSIAETYSLYLPINFTTDRTWPILFIFDPEKRGRTVNQLFRQPAEEQGYILAASNHINKDSTLLSNVKVATRLVNGVLNLLPVDMDQIYAASLAEGARVASVMPAVIKNLTGVIAVGDTWINTDFIKKGANFSFVGLAGYNDYRKFLIGETAVYLSKSGMPATTYFFDGGREWPGIEVISNALGTFTLQSISKGRRIADLSLTEEIYQNELQYAEQLRGSMQFYKAYQLLEKMSTKYAMYGKQEELEQKMKDIKKSSVFRTQRLSSITELLLQRKSTGTSICTFLMKTYILLILRIWAGGMVKLRNWKSYKIVRRRQKPKWHSGYRASCRIWHLILLMI
ncbi:hypothetical protein LZ575_09010 [Antarcticibacterium sp. 1MA-6-2]|uniref:hypothetical protein n=1 Tax=Antarcticibacterium sp. 1MA-6-2 TaxID=2908210 RepID=UPI001F1DF2EA|nr:hypothetical protein [Antarcticibacterium sp. 1MA-6-2]UJH92594.1 hypothetical protein LZ575_09010 [Antarcticibacterium sp. 1MA-6-2]